MSLGPKKQPPRKLSGKRTSWGNETLERGAVASADGIIFSGTRTEEAPTVQQLAEWIERCLYD